MEQIVNTLKLTANKPDKLQKRLLESRSLFYINECVITFSLTNFSSKLHFR